MSFTIAGMRTCAKMRCFSRPSATVVLRYQSREVHVLDLTGEPDPNQLDLCGEHIDRLVPPIGWTVRDGRAVAVRT
jgi:Protein of unknown function (DUF3499)